MQIVTRPRAVKPVDFAPMVDTSVAQLLTAAANGDRAAWEALVDRYGRLVWSVVRSFGVDMATAADISQTVWLRLIEHCGIDKVTMDAVAEAVRDGLGNGAREAIAIGVGVAGQVDGILRRIRAEMGEPDAPAVARRSRSHPTERPPRRDRA